MNIEKSECGKILLIKVSGRLDANTAKRFEEECSLLAEEKNRLVMDLSGLEYISSAGLRSVLSVGKKIKASNGRYVFCNLQPMVKEVFKISGFNSIFPMYDNLEDAIEEASS